MLVDVDEVFLGANIGCLLDRQTNSPLPKILLILNLLVVGLIESLFDGDGWRGHRSVPPLLAERRGHGALHAHLRGVLAFLLSVEVGRRHATRLLLEALLKDEALLDLHHRSYV